MPGRSEPALVNPYNRIAALEARVELRRRPDRPGRKVNERCSTPWTVAVPGATRAITAKRILRPTPWQACVMSARTALWLRWARRLFPNTVWSGAGTVVRKNHFEPRVGGGMATVGRFQQGFVSGLVPQRWVIVVADEAGKEHFVGVKQSVWDQYECGDVITEDDPLVETDRRGVAGLFE